MTTDEIVYAIQAEMLEALARLLAAGNSYGAEWQFNKLRQMGLFTEFAANAWRKNSEALLQAVKAEIRAHALSRAKTIDAVSRRGGVKLTRVLSPEADPRIVAQIALWERTAGQKIAEAAATMISGAQEQYQKAIRKAALKVELGVPGRQAMAEAVDEIAAGGLDAFVTKDGRAWTLESYTQAAVRTSSTNAATAVQWERMDEFGEDLIEISSHVGAREKCAPYQGRVFSRSGNSKRYPALSTTSYGDPGGLFGINCRHVAYPYFPEVGKTFKPVSAARNEKAYAEEQKQRALERGVRSAKLRSQVAEATGDPATIERSKQRIRDRQAALREFTKKTDRPRQYARERVGAR
jgi:hypothetical protein